MDYNIYIRDKTGGTQQKPTQPRNTGGINTKAKTQDTSGFKAIAKETKGLVAAAATTTVGKVVIALYAAYKVADKIVSTVEPFVTRETGDYRFNLVYGNVKQTISNFLNPVSFGLNWLTFNQTNRIINQRQEQERLLIGDSFVNSVSRKV